MAPFFTLLIQWFLIHTIGKGRNWARILLLVVGILGNLDSIKPTLHLLATNEAARLPVVVQSVIQVIAIVLLFQKPSSVWFREVKAKRQQPRSVMTYQQAAAPVGGSATLHGRRWAWSLARGCLA